MENGEIVPHYGYEARGEKAVWNRKVCYCTAVEILQQGAEGRGDAGKRPRLCGWERTREERLQEGNGS